jgi:hypothetical protein
VNDGIDFDTPILKWHVTAELEEAHGLYFAIGLGDTPEEALKDLRLNVRKRVDDDKKSSDNMLDRARLMKRVLDKLPRHP